MMRTANDRATIWGIPERIEYGVCKVCFFKLTRQWDADPRFRLWAMSFKRAKLAGIKHELEIRDVPTADVCPVTGVTLVHRWPTHKNPATPAHAVLDRIDPERGYVVGNVKCVSWEVAGLPITVLTPTGETPC